MKTSGLSLFLLATICLTTACTVSDPSRAKYDYNEAKENAEREKKFADLLDGLKTGGQPGRIKVSGVAVQSESTTDPRVTVVAEAGLGKNGAKPEVSASNVPKFLQTGPDVDLSQLSKKDNLVRVGCETKQVAELAKAQDLTVEGLPAPMTQSLLVVHANTVVLCGKLTELKYQFVTINADVLVMDQAEYSQSGVVGWILFNTNRLHLLGQSRVATHAMSTVHAAAIELNVQKEITSEMDGRLLLISRGADYFE